MSRLTRGGVAYNLSESPFFTEITYSEMTLKFVFSSNLYLNNFLKRLSDNREAISKSLSNRFGFEIFNDVLADIKLYSSIEKRGFLIYHNGKVIECLGEIKMDGKKLIQS